MNLKPMFEPKTMAMNLKRTVLDVPASQVGTRMILTFGHSVPAVKVAERQSRMTLLSSFKSPRLYGQSRSPGRPTSC